MKRTIIKEKLYMRKRELKSDSNCTWENRTLIIPGEEIQWKTRQKYIYSKNNWSRL